MYIEDRKKTSLILCCAWIIVPIISAITDLGGYVDTTFYIVTFLSGIFNLIGVVYYLGNYKIMTGLSTMTPDEIREYNTDAITSFSGVLFCATAYALFFVGLCLTILSGAPMGIVASAIVIVALMIFWSVHITTNKKFETRI